PDVLVAAELDPHSHLTPKRVAASDLLAAFLEFPHTDFYERGEHVVDLALRALRGEIRPVISTFDCRMIDIFPTSREPMRGVVDRLKRLEGQGSVLSVSLIHGFMAADVPEMGTRVLVVTDDDRAAGDALAEEIGREIFALRGATGMPMLSTVAGVDRAVEVVREGRTPVVVADVWDNPGGGTAGDGTLVLRELMARPGLRIGV
ncbi:MAG: M81 family metallopeptidase, partial [Rhodobacteraceae bacterium]|nr:M81 family metallopeptidase [Paracoccaceae bacterium]